MCYAFGAMAQPGFDPDTIAFSFRHASERKATALAEYEAASAELEWLRQGARLFGVALPADDEPDMAAIQELFPPASAFSNGTKPTLRQAIMAFVRESPATPYTVQFITASLADLGWLPQRDDAQKRVSDLAGIMAGDEQLERVERGVYKLHPKLA
ncbi:MAG: hypothetical protein KGJ43_03580, partial [Acidobacteriota bacterium]|nr:hypothetical protein [Acidobacteriota bacterium]